MSAQERRTPGMRAGVMFAIRDARDLDVYEKSFLFAVESRGSAFTRRSVLAADTGMSPSKVNNVATALHQRGLITVQRRRNPDGSNKPTVYTVIGPAVQALVPSDTDVQSPEDQTSQGSEPMHSSAAGGVHVKEDPGSNVEPEVEPEEQPEVEPEEDQEEDQDEEHLHRDPRDPRPGRTTGRVLNLAQARSRSEQTLEPEMTSEDKQVALAVIQVQAGRISQIQELTGEDGEELIVIRGYEPMPLDDIAKRIRFDSDFLESVLRVLPQEEVALAHEVGWDQYEKDAADAALRAKFARFR